MKLQARAGAMLLTGVLAGTVYGATLTLPQQPPQQQDNSAQQKGKQSQDDKKKKPNAQSGSTNNTQANQSGTQTQNNPPPNNPPPSGGQPSGDKPTPLFGGTIGLKSSRQTKDSATLGFNGVGPDGQVQKSMLTASVTAFDTARAQQVAQIKVAPADLVQFIQDGALTADAAPQKP
jgi:Ni/Co efflux regulator RcnB